MFYRLFILFFLLFFPLTSFSNVPVAFSWLTFVNENCDSGLKKSNFKNIKELKNTRLDLFFSQEDVSDNTVPTMSNWENFKGGASFVASPIINVDF
jgi:hypothetical protein